VDDDCDQPTISPVTLSRISAGSYAINGSYFEITQDSDGDWWIGGGSPAEFDWAQRAGITKQSFRRRRDAVRAFEASCALEAPPVIRRPSPAKLIRDQQGYRTPEGDCVLRRHVEGGWELRYDSRATRGWARTLRQAARAITTNRRRARTSGL